MNRLLLGLLVSLTGCARGGSPPAATGDCAETGSDGDCVDDQRCTGTMGDGLYHPTLLGGDVDDNDQTGWALRAR